MITNPSTPPVRQKALSRKLEEWEVSYNQIFGRTLWQQITSKDSYRGENYQYIEASRKIKSFIASELAEKDSQIEQLQVQLAGCSVVALGGTKSPAKKSDWGWSQSYQDVLNLRRKYDALSELARKGDSIWEIFPKKRNVLRNPEDKRYNDALDDVKAVLTEAARKVRGK